MSIEVGIWRIGEDLSPISLGGMDYEERLQEILASDLSIIDPSLMAIGREVPTGVGGRIDILAIDAEGNLTVIELKRSRTPREVVAQVLDYASCIRRMTSEEIADLFIEYQQRSLKEVAPKGINEALNERFNTIPDELNQSHRLLIVAEDLDPSTERIVLYLRDEYAVDISVVLFRAFQDNGRLYLTRTWLNDPFDISAQPSSSRRQKGEWNGEFYVSFGEGESRTWSDARKYGYVSGGGGEWYVKTLRMLEPGNRIWVSVPGKGYVGVGKVVTPAVRFDKFNVNQNGSTVPITSVDIQAPKALKEEQSEHFVGVEWIKTVDIQDAVRERGFFGNQNTVAQPRDPKWNFTVERLKSIWGIE